MMVEELLVNIGRNLGVKEIVPFILADLSELRVQELLGVLRLASEDQ